MSSEMLQQLQLTQCSLRKNLLGEHVRDFLDRNTFSVGCVGSGTDDTVSPLSKLLRNYVAIVDDEILIENFEGLSSDHCTVESHDVDACLAGVAVGELCVACGVRNVHSAVKNCG